MRDKTYRFNLLIISVMRLLSMWSTPWEYRARSINAVETQLKQFLLNNFES